ncbi:MAG TPA: response regulator [Candidatus Angelobacter sp.]|nr:response regulator [Candidatus Angelobacter sp.]
MPDTPAARFLIVDDDEVLMKSLCNTLRNKGYETVGCDSGQAALTALQTTRFDLLLTDLMMPGMDGMALLKIAREADPDLVCVLMTGAGTIASAVEAMKAGALDYILKPFKLGAILPVLSRSLTMGRLRKENMALDRRVREQVIELEAANQELEAFSYSISHDLRAPLRAVDGFSNMLLRQAEWRLLAEDRDLLGRIRAGAEQMSKLVDGLLNLSRLGRQSLSKGPTDLGGLVAEVLDGLSKEREGRKLEIRVSDLPECIGDATLLKVVFVNLISNAIKFTAKKEVAVVEIGCSGQNGKTVYSVRDNGEGFDMEYVHKLFAAFQRLHSRDEFEGTGLGLSIVQRIIQRHGGRIWAEAEVAKGAAFYFTLT